MGRFFAPTPNATPFFGSVRNDRLPLFLRPTMPPALVGLLLLLPLISATLNSQLGQSPTINRDNHAQQPQQQQQAQAAERFRAPKPTLADLGRDVTIKGWRAAVEWEPLSDEERVTVEQMRVWLGHTEFAQVPLDLAVCFVRGYAYRPDWPRASYAYLERCIDWRKEMGGEIAFQPPPARRDLFESLCQGGPIGRDAEGHPVVLERLGRIPPKQLLQQFDEAEFHQQAYYTKEATRLLCAAHSLQLNRRVYKVVTVLDMRGFGMAHASRGLLSLIKSANQRFSYFYPETLYKLYIVHAPWIFRAVWKTIRPWLHTITAAKIHILGESYEEAFAEAGIVLQTSLEALEPAHGSEHPAETLSGWSATVQRLVQRFGAEALREGFVPREDQVFLQGMQGDQLEMTRGDVAVL